MSWSFWAQSSLNDFMKHTLLIKNAKFRRLFGAGICSNNLNFSLRARELWLQDVLGNITLGDANWPKLRD